MQGHSHHSKYSNATDHHGSTNFKKLYEEIEQASGFSMKKELNALITEVYLSGKYGSSIDKSAALTVGMQKISKYLYDVTMTDMIASDDPAVHELALHALTVSFHKPNMHGGRGHSGQQDMGSYALMHVLNPRKETDNIREYFMDDNELSKAEGAELRGMFKNGMTFADMFGKNGGHSADGSLGESLHPKSLRDLSEWAGVDLPRWAEVGSNKVSLQFVNFDSDNSDGIFLGIGKKGHGGSDKSHGPGRNKFEQTMEYEPVARKLDFTPGEASGTSSGPAPNKPTPDHDHGGGDTGGDAPHDGPTAVDDMAQTAQNRTIIVDVLANDKAAHGDTPKLVDVSYDGNTSLVSIQGDKIKVNPLSAHRNDRTETITYTVEDSHGSKSTAVLKVEIGKGGTTPVVTKPKPPAPVEDPELLEFYFIDTETDQIIGKIENGGTVSASDVKGQVSIFATDVDDTVQLGAVRLSYDGHTQMERVEPYALVGNVGDDHRGCKTFERGTHNVDIDVFGTNQKLIESFDFTFDVV